MPDPVQPRLPAVEAWHAFARAAFQRQLAYRTANWAGLITNAFFLFFRAYALRACYEGRTTIGDLDVRGIVTYVTVSQALLMVIPQWGRVGVAESVRSGQIAMDLCRPVGYFEMFLSARFGVGAYYALFRFVPLMAIGLAAGLLDPPENPALLPVFLVTVLLGLWIANALIFLVEITAFWLGSERGVRYVVMGAGNLLSGLILPISFFPGSVQAVSRLLPFEYTLYLPVRVYLGTVSVEGAAAAVATQMVWVVLLTFACRAALAAGTRKLVIHGG